MSESASPESPLSVEQATALLAPEPVEEASEAAPVEAAPEPEIETGDQPVEEPAGEPEKPPEGDEQQEAEPVVAAEPPKYWSQDAKAKFAALPPELQAVVLAQEGPREEAAAKAKAAAEEVRKTANAELGKVQALAEHLNDFLPKALETFQSRWGSNPDWVAYAQEHGVEAMTLAKTQHEQELSLLQRTAQQAAQAQALAHETFVKAEFATLAEIAPELADPVTGPKVRTEVTQYLVADGIDPANIKNISAREMRIAHKAMLWDQAQAKLKAAPAPKPAPVAVARTPVRPAAAVAQAPSERTAAQVANRFAQTRSVDDAVALLLARKA